jgi:zona occludens toxin
MFYLITATMGAGKTLFVVNKLKDVTDRPIYYYGIKELKLPWKLLENPYDWEKEVPDKSIVVIDECQTIFPQRNPREPVPPGLVSIEQHRHRGIDIYFITQHPMMLDKHARRITNIHIHLKRKTGKEFSTLYTCTEYTDFDEKGAGRSCEKTVFKFPKKTYGLYLSAVEHTHSRPLPKKLLLLPALLLVIIYSAYSGYDTLTSKSASSPAEISNNNSVTQLPNPSGSILPSVFSSSDKKDNQHIPYSNQALIPVEPKLPVTAPFYSAFHKPKSFPRLSCVMSGNTVKNPRCLCHTQQGTRHKIAYKYCRDIVLNNGVFDFTKPLEDNKTKQKPYDRGFQQVTYAPPPRI